MEHPGHGESRFAVPAAMVYSRASHILSRYRPIAPKPSLPKTDTDPQSASSVTNDRCSKTSTSGEYTQPRRRSRKRVLDNSSAFKNTKRKPSVEIGCDPTRRHDQNSASIFTLPRMEGVHFSHGGEGSRTPLSVAASDMFASYQCVPASPMEPIESRAVFDGSASMQIAAKMFPVAILSDAGDASKLQYSGKGGIALPSSASESSSMISNLCSTTCSAYGDDSLQVQLIPALHFAEGSDSSSAPKTMRKNLVTLSLLPDTPLRECTPYAASSPNTTSLSRHAAALSMEALDDYSSGGMIQLSLSPTCGSAEQESYQSKTSFGAFAENRTATSEAVERIGLATAMEADSGASFHLAWAQYTARNGSSPPLIDASYLEQTYVASSDPVLLTDEQYQILWANVSFKKAIADRMSRRQQERGAYIDHLGVPTGLTCFTFRQPDFLAPRCRAVLWGFLKKMVFQKPSPNPEEELPVEDMDASDCRPIVPHPVRPVGSTICLECITEVNRLFPLPKTLDIAKEQMDQAALPCLISDGSNCVLWVNAAYKNMVGQQQQPPQNSVGFGVPEHLNGSSKQLAKDVSLVFLNDQPPVDAASFSGRARLHWFNVGDSWSITVPCHVKKMDDKENGSLLLWSFHVSAVDHLRGGLGMNESTFYGRSNEML
ncbi:hypothetical protein O6H91_03G130900 [Diphasiastrum complanatum]|uniref:Uncharacterized protein n=4 Tax=Diphasiastrum complanatum TaxID=34168 RepID=A0ACC2EBP5_DIPCM|nr:hypothetical protein O6H91_03G130900 [Diphasiastrum complanatum]KAJ7563933.1 hypothetical protein O6H91_03G130900 [Diphasiastrum complanatum]KAJ7563934.1 hypothetical protein O6H91_03G130900 [Diphasiastrum complanatum]KAJ7563935.1 hypothetical protein O6H91_03G130900 [Diphasiastrum complanatum]